MTELTPIQRGISIANSLTGYIAHIPGSVSCRHCELAQEIVDAFRTVEQATERRVWEEAARIIRDSHTFTLADIVAEFRRHATEGKSDV